jgi:hypothetical protein
LAKGMAIATDADAWGIATAPPILDLISEVLHYVFAICSRDNLKLL